MPTIAPGVAFLFLITAAVAQQDAVGVTFDGLAVAFDSHTGAGVSLGATSPNGTILGHNATARVGNRLFTTDRTPVASSTFQYHLDSMDAATGRCIRIFTNVGDLRGLAAHPTQANTMLGVLDGSPDRLVTISTANGAVTQIGSTGLSSLQALTDRGTVVYGWDLSLGLVTLSPTTGVATDVNSQVGTNGALIQFLFAHTDGRLLGGNRNLYQIDRTTGVATLLGPIAGGTFDLRGAEERVAFAQNFGTGCATVSNTPFVLDVNGFLPSAFFGASSSGHTPLALGIQVIGFSNQQASGQNLPLLLDPQLGTVGCTLYTSLDVTFFRSVQPTGFFNFITTWPAAAAGVTLFTQQTVLEPTLPGSMTWSDAAMVKIGF